MTGKPTYEATVRTHGITVRRVCRAVVGAADADDAWSETFLSAMRAYPDLPADANIEAWLVTIAHRKAIDVIRKTGRNPIPMAVPPDAVAVDHDHSGVDTELAAALQRLPPKQRQAVAYHYLGGLPYSEVAALIGGKPEAARRAAADAIASLRRSFPGAASKKRATDEHRN